MLRIVQVLVVLQETLCNFLLLLGLAVGVMKLQPGGDLLNVTGSCGREPLSREGTESLVEVSIKTATSRVQQSALFCCIYAKVSRLNVRSDTLLSFCNLLIANHFLAGFQRGQWRDLRCSSK